MSKKDNTIQPNYCQACGKPIPKDAEVIDDYSDHTDKNLRDNYKLVVCPGCQHWQVVAK